ncbi:hypothetical protein [Cupriavidus necator]
MQSTLMIKDLPLDKKLDGKKMSAVRGGSASNVNAFNTNVANGPFGTVNAPVTQVAIDARVSTPTYLNFGGIPMPYPLSLY